MVHDDLLLQTTAKVDFEMPQTNGGYVEIESQERQDRMEDMLEEIEEIDDIQLDMDECTDDKTDRSCEIEFEEERFRGDTPLKGKDKLFSCDKCNYVTHLRARFTKHVKYHSMPMIKCIVCDFRTPYKWNLDRHMKNHGGIGSFKCSMCNFTADIKQSLTVHEMNHHTPQAGHSHVNRRRNRVGASDAAQADEASLLLIKEEEGSGDSRSSHSASEMGLQNMEKDLSCNSDSNDTSEAPNKISHFVHNDHSQQSPSSGTDDSKGQKNKRTPRPLPQLIPLNTSTPNQNKTTNNEPPAKKMKLCSDTETPDTMICNPESPTYDNCFTNNTFMKDTECRKKNESFFDKLKKRLLTETGEEGSLICKNCSFQSKCLSEHSVHEKNCIPLASRSMTNTLMPSSGSTRCQNCRHRCKSSADLYVHMQSCGKSANLKQNEISQDQNSASDAGNINRDKDVEPHPMENVVFVWNNIEPNEPNKFEIPLDININDDSTLPDMTRTYEIELVDENESMNLSPSQAAGKNVFKCPHCSFWASTASRFHVHIVGHLNKKPFECSICKYKSNWRWDITKHIKLKSVRDPDHNDAKVLMTDETGRRNYSKYTKFLAIPVPNENGKTEFRYLDPNTYVDDTMDVDDPADEFNDTNTIYDMQPLNLQTKHFEFQTSLESIANQDKKVIKRTLWKCKKCNYKDPSKDALLEHVREHAKVEGASDEVRNKKPESSIDPADLAYRCGHCHQLSNWKHVIQRHCRLKHNGVIKVITTVKQKPELNSAVGSLTIDDITSDFCTKCPFKSNDKQALFIHLQQHQPSTNSVFKCYFCPFFVKNESELIQHLHVHGVEDPEDFISKARGCRSPLPDLASALTPQGASTKRHRCSECPYETNSKSQYMYHEQFHRLPADTPYKCPECNYSVSKRHLLHQHLRVHGIHPKKNESEAELELMLRADDISDAASNSFNEIPFVWVSAKNEFHKMYKCRYCSYVNSQKCKIPIHEKIHCLVFENDASVYYKCSECKFTFDNAVKLAEHSKSHGDLYGRIYCPVADDIPDDEQVAKLRKVIELEKLGNNDSSPPHEDGESKEIKTLYFCQLCPARYFTDTELQVHDKNHNSNLSVKCKNCNFAVSEESELVLHAVVHSDEYHTKTRMLKFAHNSHPAHRPPCLESIRTESGVEIWVINHNKKNEIVELNNKKSQEVKHTPKQYNCKECPAKFFKGSALNYHMGLHGGEGEYKCKSCSYAVKNIGNLAKHEALHEKENKNSNGDYESGEDADYKNIPISGTDLFQRKTEAQKRVLTDKDKLVKPNDHFPPVLQADPQFGFLMHGNPEFIYPTYLKNGRQKEKRYKCHKCPSAFEKREQYKIHLSLHGSKQRYKCELCDYSVKYYANYVQHMRKHQMNDEAQAERKKGGCDFVETEIQDSDNLKGPECADNLKLAVKTIPKGMPKTDFQQFSYRDQQTLRLLQRRRSMSSINKDASATESTNKRKLHSCLLCPYTNHRQDALNNHYKRHDDTDLVNVANSANHKCNYCDLIVLQSHFLKEHLKTHFNYQKALTPECFVASEDVNFTITKIDNESQPYDLRLEIQNKDLTCNTDKIFVNIKTGELLV